MIDHKKKIFSLHNLKNEIEALKETDKKVGFTNGCFDIIHMGHVKLLKRASELCDKVIVALNSDSSVTRLKGESRPIISQNERAEVLASIQYVDYVIIFDESTPLHLIEQLKPDILVKGSDWEKEDIVGAEVVEKNGGEVINDVYIKGKSSSDIIQKIKNNYGRK